MTRHTAAVLHLAAGENPIFISRLLGHSSGELLFRRYAPFVPNALGGDGAGAGEAGGVTSGVSSLRMHTNPHLWWIPFTGDRLGDPYGSLDD